ncbi:MAG: hypothetical protein IJT16_08620 [Lachnospiraceae bacterium]|nr:hypothetical protein [Lachnospiraceae bacterium]
MRKKKGKLVVLFLVLSVIFCDVRVVRAEEVGDFRELVVEGDKGIAEIPELESEELVNLGGIAITMKWSDYQNKYKAFISDSRWCDGAPYGSGQKPKHPYSQKSSECSAYAHDFVSYVFGTTNHFGGGDKYGDLSGISSGDVITINNEGHVFVVLERNGNDLYTAEGNYNETIAKVGWNYKIVDGSLYCNFCKPTNALQKFDARYHFVDFSDGPEAENAAASFSNIRTTKVEGNSARVNATMTWSGDIKYVGVEYGKSGSNLDKQEWDYDEYVVENEWFDLKGLSSNTKYYYRFFAWTSGKAQIFYSDVNSFTTGAGSTIISGDSDIEFSRVRATSIGQTFAKVEVHIEYDEEDYDASYIGVEYGTNKNALADGDYYVQHSAPKSDEWFVLGEEGDMDPLEPGVTYYFRFFTWEGGKKNLKYSSIGSFTTISKPVFSNVRTTEIGATYAVAAAAMTWKGDDLGFVGVDYGTSRNNLENQQTTYNKNVQTNVSYILENLEPNTTYYYQFFGISCDKNVVTRDAAIYSFTTDKMSYMIDAVASEGGSIDPEGVIIFEEGNSKTFRFYSDEGYEIEDVLVDSASVGKVDSYTFSNIHASHEILVLFKQVAVVTPTPVPVSDTVISVGSTVGSAGGTVSVPISVAGNPGIGGLALTVSCDPSMTIASIERGDVLASGTFNPDAGTGLVQWYTMQDPARGDGVLFTLKLNVKAGTAKGSYPVSVNYKDGSRANITDENGNTLSVSFLAGSVAIADGVMGDITGDGEVAMGDVVKLARAVAGNLILTDAEKTLADVTGDGDIAMGDVVKLARFVAGSLKSL